MSLAHTHTVTRLVKLKYQLHPHQHAVQLMNTTNSVTIQIHHQVICILLDKQLNNTDGLKTTREYFKRYKV